MINRILRIWNAIEKVLIGILLFAALGLFLGGAVLRAVSPIHAIDWAEEVSLYAIIWATVLAGSSLVTSGGHISTQIFVAGLRTPLRRAVGWGVTVLTIGFCAAMLLYGWQAFQFGLLLDERSASTLRTPQAWAVFLAMPVGMALILGRIALMLLQGLRPFGNDEDDLPGFGKP